MIVRHKVFLGLDRVCPYLYSWFDCNYERVNQFIFEKVLLRKVQRDRSQRTQSLKNFAKSFETSISDLAPNSRSTTWCWKSQYYTEKLREIDSREPSLFKFSPSCLRYWSFTQRHLFILTNDFFIFLHILNRSEK